MLNSADMGTMIFDILRNDFHRPIVNGKCSRENIEEQITIGMYSDRLPAMTQKDVEMICDLVDELIAEWSNVE